MEIEALQLEILEAKRTIARNTMILQLNEQSVKLLAEKAALESEVARLKEVKEVADGN